jgi:hypothetical protein
MPKQSSLFDRVFSHPRPLWVTLLVSAVLLGLPFAAAAFDGELAAFLSSGRFRVYLIFPTVTLYVWLVSPLLDRTGDEMLRSLRPVIELDDEQFAQVLKAAEQVNPLHEALAFLGGVLIGWFATTGGKAGLPAGWLGWELMLTGMLMYGTLVWVVFVSVHSTRVNAALHRQPMRIDILDISPFDPVGRQSLLLALVFIGGMALSLLLTLPVIDLSTPFFWLFYGAMVLATGLIFFLGMRPTHRVLQDAKQRELEPVTRRLNASGRALMSHSHNPEQGDDLARQIQALALYEQRLQGARTWPYNTGMLRTLFFSVLIPLGTVALRLTIELLARE